MSSRNKILVTGASGYLGSYLVRELQARSLFFTASVRTNPVLHSQTVDMDIRDLDSVVRGFEKVGPKVVINLAANNPVRGPEEMESVNSTGTANIGLCAARLEARVIHISSDVVHDGKNPPYSEDSIPSANSAYGLSKADAERAISSQVRDHAIIRTSLIYGTDKMDRGTQVFADRLSAGEPVTFFKDVLRQPVWVNTLVDSIIELVDHHHNGIINIAGSELVSRDSYGRQLLKHFKVPKTEMIQSGLGSEIAPKMPLNTSLDLTLAKTILATPLPGLSEVLETVN